jgi:hypothetical protein
MHIFKFNSELKTLVKGKGKGKAATVLKQAPHHEDILIT